MKNVIIVFFYNGIFIIILLCGFFISWKKEYLIQKGLEHFVLQDMALSKNTLLHFEICFKEKLLCLYKY